MYGPSVARTRWAEELKRHFRLALLYMPQYSLLEFQGHTTCPDLPPIRRVVCAACPSADGYLRHSQPQHYPRWRAEPNYRSRHRPHRRRHTLRLGQPQCKPLHAQKCCLSCYA